MFVRFLPFFLKVLGFRRISRDSSNTTRVLSFLFLDIARFDQYVRKTSPEEVFESLRDLLALVNHHAREYSGVVDRGWADGLLIRFDPTSGNHAEQALSCAVAIQREKFTIAIPRPISRLKFRRSRRPSRIFWGSSG